MRRKDREVTDFTKMTAILNSCDCCRLGLIDGDESYIVPMNFGYETQDGDLVLYFHCAGEGRKIDLIPKQKTVSFEMDTHRELVTADNACGFSYLYQCVMGKGSLEILTDHDAKVRGLQRVMSHYSHTDCWEFHPAMMEKIHVLKLTVSEWSCKEH
ncbi:MAG: pyridoxamine 5'-phosphate oxidase family protein [Coprococcus sp.]|nr:pyridoxamine 5'-phosphate oxidase family protein [Coprococcus sp.]